ncbi:MAG: hypothetical protein GKR89_36510 [Candidatus Latescibacteria bacterium]|nr:hypothetical protein [Candidatus Latescibacterota bacterium]
MSGLDAQLMPWLYSVGLLILGFGLVLLEIFVIPGFNIFGVLGFSTLCLGVYFAYVRLGLLEAGIVALIGLLGTAILIRLLIKARAWQRLVLESKTTRQEGYDSGRAGLGQLIGQQGVALTPLRPAGRAQIGDESVDVVTQGGFVVKGEAVEVVLVAGNRVVVEPCGAAPPEEDS